MKINDQQITSQKLSGQERIEVPAKLFGMNFPFVVEPTVFAMAGRLSADYQGGLWNFHRLSNGGFFMAPAGVHTLNVRADNGYQGVMSCEAFGITVCLYVYSVLSFQPGQLADASAEQYHLLRAYARGHVEWGQVAAAID